MHYVIESGGAVRSREFSDEGKAEMRGDARGQQMDSRVRKRAMSWGKGGRACGLGGQNSNVAGDGSF